MDIAKFLKAPFLENISTGCSWHSEERLLNNFMHVQITSYVWGDNTFDSVHVTYMLFLMKIMYEYIQQRR